MQVECKCLRPTWRQAAQGLGDFEAELLDGEVLRDTVSEKAPGP